LLHVNLNIMSPLHLAIDKNNLFELDMLWRNISSTIMFFFL
jgi:hypothetical protein